MANELAMITVAIISGAGVLAGSFLTWLLNSITAGETAKRAERSAMRLSTEERYLSVMTSLELFIRSRTRGAEIDRELASLNAVIGLFGSDAVKDRFKVFGEKFRAYENAYEESGKSYVSISDAADDFPDEWNKAISAMYKLSGEMRQHIMQLCAFKD